MKETILKYWWAQVGMLSVFEILSCKDRGMA